MLLRFLAYRAARQVKDRRGLEVFVGSALTGFAVVIGVVLLIGWISFVLSLVS
jgi:hypothetical protein